MPPFLTNDQKSRPKYKAYRQSKTCKRETNGPRDLKWGLKWMDGWLAMETDAGRAVMKTPATKAKDLFKVVLPTPVATTHSNTKAAKDSLAITTYNVLYLIFNT